MPKAKRKGRVISAEIPPKMYEAVKDKAKESRWSVAKQLTFIIENWLGWGKA